MAEVVRDEAKDTRNGLAAEDLARDAKESDTNPLGHCVLILTALESHSTAFKKL